MKYIATGAVVLTSVVLGASLFVFSISYSFLMKKFSLPTFPPKRSLTVNKKNYYTCYIAHKLGPEIPLIIFIHGLGASVEQWKFQLDFFSLYANVLLIQLPTLNTSHLSNDNLLNDLASDILFILNNEGYRRTFQRIVLVGHSLGSLVSLLLSNLTPLDSVILIAPRAQYPKSNISPVLFRYFFYFYVYLYNYYRFTQRNSSYKKFIYDCTNQEAVKLQRSINCRSSTVSLLVYLKAINDFSLKYSESLMTDPALTGTTKSYLIICGKYDVICPSSESELVAKYLSAKYFCLEGGHNLHLECCNQVNQLIYDHLSSFIKEITHEYQSDSNLNGKWSLKNYEKWKLTLPVGKVIQCNHLLPKSKGNPLSPLSNFSLATFPFVLISNYLNYFYNRHTLNACGFGLRGLKILRDGDDTHSPSELVKAYPYIKVIIDITHDSDIPYTPIDSIQYIKFSTLSKVPPSMEQVKGFIKIIDDLVSVERFGKSYFEIGVHCHYGFNRTGFLICSYLIERMNCTVKEALEKFAWSREGIRHLHFKQELYERYGEY